MDPWIDRRSLDASSINIRQSTRLAQQRPSSQHDKCRHHDRSRSHGSEFVASYYRRREIWQPSIVKILLSCAVAPDNFVDLAIAEPLFELTWIRVQGRRRYDIAAALAR